MSVYFITCRQTGTVKIGSSLEPSARLKELQTAHPYELKVEAVLPGGCDEERDFHRRFSEERLKGEWFRITDMIELIIRQNPPKPPTRIPTREEVLSRVGPFPETSSARRLMTKRKLTPQERRVLTFDQARLRSRVMSGDIHFPFRKTVTT